MTREELIEALRREEPLFRAERVRRVSLFGSQARGDARADSDIDLLVEYEPGAVVTAWDQAGLSADLTEKLGRFVQLVRAPIRKERFRTAVEQDAVRVL